jgi:hypothetical protein
MPCYFATFSYFFLILLEDHVLKKLTASLLCDGHTLIDTTSLLPGGRISTKKFKCGQRKNDVTGKIGGRILANFYQKWQKKFVVKNPTFFFYFITTIFAPRGCQSCIKNLFFVNHCCAHRTFHCFELCSTFLREGLCHSKPATNP